MIMEALHEAEAEAGRMLTHSEVLQTVAFHMKRYNLPMNFTRWRGK
jgi:predicted transcriptional regulator